MAFAEKDLAIIINSADASVIGRVVRVVVVLGPGPDLAFDNDVWRVAHREPCYGVELLHGAFEGRTTVSGKPMMDWPRDVFRESYLARLGREESEALRNQLEVCDEAAV